MKIFNSLFMTYILLTTCNLLVANAESFYERLGVHSGASLDEIKVAYKKAAFKTHPDRFQNLPPAELTEKVEAFKGVNEAFQTLSDPEKKRMYDARSSYYQQSSSSGSTTASHAKTTNSKPADIFNSSMDYETIIQVRDEQLKKIQAAERNVFARQEKQAHLEQRASNLVLDKLEKLKIRSLDTSELAHLMNVMGRFDETWLMRPHFEPFAKPAFARILEEVKMGNFTADQIYHLQKDIILNSLNLERTTHTGSGFDLPKNMSSVDSLGHHYRGYPIEITEVRGAKVFTEAVLDQPKYADIARDIRQNYNVFRKLANFEPTGSYIKLHPEHMIVPKLTRKKFKTCLGDILEGIFK